MILFNNYYEEDEKLFSTGDSNLDDLLEEVYYSGIEDGYDYFQKEFANLRDMKKVDNIYNSTIKKFLKGKTDVQMFDQGPKAAGTAYRKIMKTKAGRQYMNNAKNRTMPESVWKHKERQRSKTSDYLRKHSPDK